MAFDAEATVQRTFVASYGLDSNPCTLVSPCRSFGVAMAQTTAAGEIVVLDSAGYGAVSITQSVTIEAPPGIYAGVSVAGGTGVTVNAGAGSKVTLRGLTINGRGGTTGIAFQSGAALYLDKVAVRGFAGGGGVGLNAATGAANASLFITDSIFRDNATGLKSATTSGTLILDIERTMFERNAIGADVQGITVGSIHSSTFASGGTGLSAGSASSGRAVKLDLRDCTISDNSAAGVAATAPSSPTTLTVISSLLSGNAVAIQVAGAGNSVYALGNTILRNGLGLDATSSGAIASAGDNRLFLNVANGSFSSTLNQPPGVNAGTAITVTLPSTASLGGTAFDDGRPNPPAALTTEWKLFSGPGPVVFGNAANLATTASFGAPGDYVLRLTASDSDLSSSADVAVTVHPDPALVLPPDPATVAPPIDATVATTIGAGSAFLYTGPNPIQTGVAPGTIDAVRAAVIRGKVMTSTGAPLPGVSISILDHPELGQTLSRADGMFDLAVNGGGPLTVSYVKPGLLPAQRTLPARWQHVAVTPDVVMIPLHPLATLVDLASATPMQVVRGAVIADADGTRQMTLLFPAGTTASMTLPGGGSAPLTKLTVRATEYTVGNSGPKAMPGELPPTSSYTYAAEFSVDEAIVASATSVVFSQPVVSYLENFLGFPVGWDVPFGQYDRGKAAWKASPNGRVIKILGVSAGAADLDIDGSGLPAGASALAALGVTTAEQQSLASLYAVGLSLWRVPVTHFSPGDLNWGGGLPTAAAPPKNKPPKDKPKPDPCQKANASIIECQNQVLGERVPVAGTPYTLNYRSSRVPGFKISNRLRIPLSGASVPASLHAIDMEVLIAGRKFTQSFPALPNQSTTLVWDGKDAYGRTMQGPQVATVRVGYAYQGVYTMPAGYLNAFALYGSALSSNDTRTVLTLWQEWQASVGVFDMNTSGLGGWSLSPHHVYDPGGHVLYRGDGGFGNAAATRIENIIGTHAGTGMSGCTGDLGPAVQARLFGPEGIAVAADGSVYFVDVLNFVVRRIGTDGIIKTVVGIPHSGCQGDDTPATHLAFVGAQGVAVAPDGSLYVSDYNGQRVYRIGMGGSVAVAAGTGTGGFSGDGGPATSANLTGPRGLAVAPDGTLYIADTNVHRIRRVGTDGIITTVAGTGVAGFGGDGGLAAQAKLTFPIGVALTPDGALYISDEGNHRVRRVGTDGIITTAAGIANFGFGGDGGPATLAALSNPVGIAAGPDGSVYVTDNNRVRRIAPDGIIDTVAGSAPPGFGGDGGFAKQAQLLSPRGVAVGPDGSVYISDTLNNRVRRVRSGLPGFGTTDLLIASDDGTEAYRFDALGRHLATLDTLTGATLLTFGYDAAGRLITATDADSNVTTIQRISGAPAGIVGPYGAHTTFTRDANGFLASIANPMGETTVLTSTAEGLLSTLTDPRGGLHSFSYDAFGRLTFDQDPAGGSNALNRVDGDQTYTVSRTTALGRVTSYEVTSLANGDEHDVNTLPSGLAATQVHGANAKDSVTLANGMTTSQVLGPDPQFGVSAPLPTSTMVTTPLGKNQTTTIARTAALANPNDPLSLTALNETVTINGRAYTSAYTGASRVLTQTTPTGRQSTLTLDALARPTQGQIAGLLAVNRTYDSHGRLATMTAGSGLATRTYSFAYGTDGNLQTLTDPIGRTRAFTYDAAGRATTQTLTDGQVVHFAYDANGNIASLTPPGRPAHGFTYTPVDLMASYTPPNVGSPGQTAYAFDADRQLTSTSRPDGRTITIGYDTAGRPNAMTIARGPFSFAYDATTGNLATVGAPGGIVTTYAYDGSLPTGTTWSGPVTGSVTGTYDNDFRVTSLAVNGSAITFVYDNDNLLTQAGTLALARSAQNGLVTGTTLGNVADTWTYNGFGEVTHYNAAHLGTTIFAQQFTLDNLGRITQKVETIGGVIDTYAYSYDLRGRLVGVAKNGTTTSTYVYDANGNRTSVTTSVTTNGTYDNQDRLTQYGNATYAYAASGELQTKTAGAQVTSYQYDELGNLVGLTLPAATTIAYLTDGSNRRIGRKVNGTLVQGFLYQDDLAPVAELDGANNVVSRFVYAMDDNVPDYMIKGGVTYRIITDQLGSPRLVVDVATGTVAQRIDYDEFGQVVNDTSPGFQPFGFAGGLYDSASGLVRFGIRDYAADVGRWTARDPLLFNGGQLNLYAYVDNDPMNATDVRGARKGGRGKIIDLTKKKKPKAPPCPDAGSDSPPPQTPDAGPPEDDLPPLPPAPRDAGPPPAPRDAGPPPAGPPQQRRTPSEREIPVFNPNAPPAYPANRARDLFEG